MIIQCKWHKIASNRLSGIHCLRKRLPKSDFASQTARLVGALYIPRINTIATKAHNSVLVTGFQLLSAAATANRLVLVTNWVISSSVQKRRRKYTGSLAVLVSITGPRLPREFDILNAGRDCKSVATEFVERKTGFKRLHWYFLHKNDIRLSGFRTLNFLFRRRFMDNYRHTIVINIHIWTGNINLFIRTIIAITVVVVVAICHPWSCVLAQSTISPPETSALTFALISCQFGLSACFCHVPSLVTATANDNAPLANHRRDWGLLRNLKWAKAERGQLGHCN